MIQYKIYVKNSASRYLYVDIYISDIKSPELKLQLPAWRPGRYELGNFAKNIKKMGAFDENGQALELYKNTKDCWHIKTGKAREIKVTYSYYASDLNAGSTYIDETQVYLNPCNCLMYILGNTEQVHELYLDIPATYFIATSLKKEGNKLTASNYDELADSPVIASPCIKTVSFSVNNILFYLHFNGECNPDEPALKRDFTRFIQEQLAFFDGIHFSEYHFLFQILPVRFHHGVEHTKNTVIAFGPGYNLRSSDTYNEFLGLCCHELFHTWNIKTIRPAEMLPYDYTKENYARTGFVYEGVTTYYGDKLLLTSGTFAEETYFKTFEERLTKHLHSFGRYNLSVGDSSFDNWLDGYTPGAPYRKTNIYDEGCLISFMLDVLILKNSSAKNSLQSVMKKLYDDFYKKGKGYTEADYTSLCSEAAGTDLDSFFQNHVYGLEPYEPTLHACMNDIGLRMEKIHAHAFYEKNFGIKANDVAHHKKITMLTPYSPAWEAGIAIGDEIIAVNSFSLKNDLHQWLSYFADKDERVNLTILSNGKLKQVEIPLNKDGDYFYTYKIVRQEKSGNEQLALYKNWKQSFFKT